MSEKKARYGFWSNYFHTIDTTPFDTKEEQWQAWESFVDMVCMMMLVQREHKPAEIFARIGLIPDNEELMMLLEPHEAYRFPEKETVRRVFDMLYQKGDGNNPALAFLPLWQFSSPILDSVEFVALLLSLCVDRNRKYEKIFAILQEESSGIYKPTVGFVHDFCDLFLTSEENRISILLDEKSVLNRFLMEQPKESGQLSRLSRTFVLRKQALEFFENDGQTDLGRLSIFAEVLECKGAMPEYMCHETFFDELLSLYHEFLICGMEGVVYLRGQKGCGMSFFLQCIGTVYGRDVLQVDVRKLLTADESSMYELLCEISWKCMFEQHLLFLDHCTADDRFRVAITKILSVLQDDLRYFIVGSEEELISKFPIRGQEIERKMPQLSLSDQTLFWKRLAKNLAIIYDADVHVEEIVSKYNATPGRIFDILQKVRMLAVIDEKRGGYMVNQSMIEQEIRRWGEINFHDIAHLIPASFTMDDLCVTDEVKTLISQVINRVRYRSHVFGAYGFSKKVPYGTGISVVLYGPPGTGKTMAAQVIAAELGLNIYRCDLSQIVSKYIGETSKNLSRIFDAAQQSNAILFFDEADSLFSKRMDVNNSNDKHANAETAFLLQKMESYAGICILATNVANNFDNAFVRRITYMIPISKPDEKQRLQLWENMFPKQTPLSPLVNFEKLSQNLELTGSEIKSIALNAVYLSLGRGGECVTMDDIVQAIDMENKKVGKLTTISEIYGMLR
ncbi:MAG: ATP-binding protein [bacterium]|nr:ATP-binding protein [bacterium]